MVKILEGLTKQLERMPQGQGEYGLSPEEDKVDKYLSDATLKEMDSTYCKEVPCQCITVKCY